MLLVLAVLLGPGTGQLACAGPAVARRLLRAHRRGADGRRQRRARPPLRTSGLALLTTVTSLASLASSVLIGALWSAYGPQAAFAVFAVGMLAALLWSAWTLLRQPD